MNGRCHITSTLCNRENGLFPAEKQFLKLSMTLLGQLCLREMKLSVAIGHSTGPDQNEKFLRIFYIVAVAVAVVEALSFIPRLPRRESRITHSVDKSLRVGGCGQLGNPVLVEFYGRVETLLEVSRVWASLSGPNKKIFLKSATTSGE